MECGRFYWIWEEMEGGRRQAPFYSGRAEFTLRREGESAAAGEKVAASLP